MLRSDRVVADSFSGEHQRAYNSFGNAFTQKGRSWQLKNDIPIIAIIDKQLFNYYSFQLSIIDCVLSINAIIVIQHISGDHVEKSS